jgi:hypothetical protein
MQMLEQLVASANVDTNQAAGAPGCPSPRMLTFTPGETWRARMVTSKGELTIKLADRDGADARDELRVPGAARVLRRARFHRVIPRFMAQGGCPLGSGTGGRAIASTVSSHRAWTMPSRAS